MESGFSEEDKRKDVEMGWLGEITKMPRPALCQAKYF